MKTLRRELGSHILLIVLIGLSLYPFLFMISASLKDNGQFYHSYFGISFPFHFENYVVAWDAISAYMMNSVILTVVSVALMTIVGALAAYSFARLRFRLKGFIYFSVLALMMIPAELTLIPLFIEIKQLGLLNSLWGLIIIFAAGAQSFTIFVLRQAFASIPEELFESARLDGGSELRLFWSIALPMIRSSIGTMAIWNVLGVWNSFLLPLVLLHDPSKYPITVGLLQFQNQFATLVQYGPMFAGYAIASMPLIILFIFTLRIFLRGLTSSSLKM